MMRCAAWHFGIENPPPPCFSDWSRWHLRFRFDESEGPRSAPGAWRLQHSPRIARLEPKAVFAPNRATTDPNLRFELVDRRLGACTIRLHARLARTYCGLFRTQR